MLAVGAVAVCSVQDSNCYERVYVCVWCVFVSASICACVCMMCECGHVLSQKKIYGTYQ